jgi:hypothetical protein
MFVDSIRSPGCPKCEEMMALRIIEPERPGFDSRTFECPKCFGTETVVVAISSEEDLAMGSATPRARSPRPFRTSRDLCSRYRV